MAKERSTFRNPWPDVGTARLFLRGLAEATAVDEGTKAQILQAGVNEAALAEWLEVQGVGPLAYYRWRDLWPSLADRLKPDRYAALVQTGLHVHRLTEACDLLAQADIPCALLKGVALAQTIYPEPALRTMSDIDLWLRAEDMQAATRLLLDAGYRTQVSKKRPPALQALAQGERQFYDKLGGLLEVHWAPVSGWFLRQTAQIDIDAIWQRTSPIEAGKPLVRTLAAEDIVIQVALHVVINHRYRLAAVRSFLDIALTAQTPGFSWQVVATRSRQWRVGPAVWLTLRLAQRLVGLPGVEICLKQLRPWWGRRVVLESFVRPNMILADDSRLGAAMENNWVGYLFHLFLVARVRDALKLWWQAIWPTREWLEARYGEQASYRHHLWHLLRRRRI